MTVCNVNNMHQRKEVIVISDETGIGEELEQEEEGDGEEKEQVVLGGDTYVPEVCGGRDFLSHPVLVASITGHILTAEDSRLLVFSINTGQLIRQINTGSVVSMALTDNPGEVIVANKKKITVWNYETVSVVKKFKLNVEGEISANLSPTARLQFYLPHNCVEQGEAYAIATANRSLRSLFRVQLGKDSAAAATVTSVVFRHVTLASQHVGDSGNTLVSLSDIKMHGYVNAMLLVYDRRLAKVQNFNTDRERPFTIARCHPKEKVIACGDISGRILVFTGQDFGEDLSPAKSILHWHSLPVTGLCWSAEGGHLYSGAEERVLCKWMPETGARPDFTPRLANAIVGIATSTETTVLQLADNSVLLLDRQERTIGELAGLCRNSSGWPAGLAWDGRTGSVLLNGRVGHIQVFHPKSREAYSIDITQQNYVTVERNVTPVNSEVERFALSECGLHLATLEACWAHVPRLTLKFWHYQLSSQRFVLNTQVDSPHKEAVSLLTFQPTAVGNNGGYGSAALLSCGQDSLAKVWRGSANSWDCKLCIGFRELACNTGAWSADGTVLAVAFSHIVTLWDIEASLKTTLTNDGSKEAVSCLEFGRGSSCSRLLYSAVQSQLFVWDLVSLDLVWQVPAAGQISCLTSCPLSGHLAVIAHDRLTILNTWNRTTIAALDGVSATGSAVYGVSEGQSHLYYVTFSGLIKRIGPRQAQSLSQPAPPKQRGQFLLPRASGRTAREIAAESRTNNDDVAAMLSVPLHALPAASLLAKSFLKCRVAALPRLRSPAVLGGVENGMASAASDQLMAVERLKKIFQTEKIPTNQELDLKSFAVIFKKSEDNGRMTAKK